MDATRSGCYDPPRTPEGDGCGQFKIGLQQIPAPRPWPCRVTAALPWSGLPGPVHDLWAGCHELVGQVPGGSWLLEYEF